MPALTKKRPPQRSPEMDWDILTDQRSRVFKQGEDFTTTPGKFQQSARQAAKRRNMSATTWTEDGDVYVVFVAAKDKKPKKLKQLSKPNK
jgi:hypothetical protein